MSTSAQRRKRREAYHQAREADRNLRAEQERREAIDRDGRRRVREAMELERIFAADRARRCRCGA